ncbi:hypothetical protein DV736_g3016, partial [Chaetothyriales sp. CBS 134916]
MRRVSARRVRSLVQRDENTRRNSVEEEKEAATGAPAPAPTPRYDTNVELKHYTGSRAHPEIQSVLKGRISLETARVQRLQNLMALLNNVDQVTRQLREEDLAGNAAALQARIAAFLAAREQTVGMWRQAARARQQRRHSVDDHDPDTAMVHPAHVPGRRMGPAESEQQWRELDWLVQEQAATFEPPAWLIQKRALAAKFGSEGWSPRRKLSPDAMLHLRTLHAANPQLYTTPLLASTFKQSPEAIRRILKSKWLGEASADAVQARRERWARRHDRIWDVKSELGLRPKRKSERKAEDASVAGERVESEIWAEEVLRRAREGGGI